MKEKLVFCKHCKYKSKSNGFETRPDICLKALSTRTDYDGIISEYESCRSRNLYNDCEDFAPSLYQRIINKINRKKE